MSSMKQIESELKMAELKNEINLLQSQLNQSNMPAGGNVAFDPITKDIISEEEFSFKNFWRGLFR